MCQASDLQLSIRLRILLLHNRFYYILLLIACIFSFYSTKIIKYSSKFDINDTYFSGIIKEYNIDGDKLSITVKTDKNELIKGNYYIKSIEEKNYYMDNIKYGLHIDLAGDLSEPKNHTIPNTFNYKKYLYNKKIYYILNIQKINIIKNENILYRIKNKVIQRIKSIKGSNYILTFVIGDKSDINYEDFNNYRLNGVTHLFAISGMHIGLFSIIIKRILDRFKLDEDKEYIIIDFILILYGLLTGYPSSIKRALTFTILLSINKIFYLNIKTINILLLAVIILIFLNPFIIYDLGFQYSLTTSFGLIYSTNILNDNNKLKNLLKTSIVAFLFSLPITLSNFYEVNPISIINNLYYVPWISTIIYPLSIMCILIKPLGYILEKLIFVTEIINKFIANNFVLNINIPFNLTISIIYYLILLLGIKYRKKLLLLLIILISYIKFKPYIDNNAYIYYLDVGQGDCSLIITPNKKEIIIIDTGGELPKKQEEWQKRNKEYHISDNVITFLKSKGITKIDYAILSHGDADHIGEFNNIDSNIKISNIVINKGKINNLENNINKNKIIDINKLKFKNIQYKSYNNLIYQNENDNSIVIEFVLYKKSFLYMGDASIKIEEDILNKYNLINIDFIKIGHHGSNTSSSKKFINNIQPKYSIVSVGKNNRYGHPKAEVLDTLKNSKIYRTDLDGSIEIKLNINGYKIRTCPP